MPDLPLELERQIFELAFRPNSRDLDLKTTLCLVARRVQVWIDRIFYELVPIENKTRGKKFLSLIHSNVKPPGFFAVVKTLFLHYRVEGTTACGILAACDKVERLTCWIPSNVAPQELPLLISRLPLHQLSIAAGHFSKISPSSTCPSTLTHVDLVLESQITPQLSQLLAPLPRLTHLCLSIEIFPVSAEYVETACASFPRLQVVIISCNSNILGWLEEDLRYSVEVDHRIVVLADPWEETTDWQLASHLWSRAKAIVEQRKKSLSVGNE